MKESKKTLKKMEAQNQEPEEELNICPFSIDISEKKDYQCTMWFITINNPQKYNYDDERINYILTTDFITTQYYCKCEEMGSVYHVHIFVVFNSRVRFSTVKKHFPEAHIEACYSTVSNNIAYIKKEGKWADNEKKQEQVIEGTIVEWGVRPPDTKGKRTDMSILYQLILNGYTTSEIIATNQDYIQHIDKIKKVKNAIKTDEYSNKLKTENETIYIFGKTGLGKSYYVLNKEGCRNVFRVTDYKEPYDGYDGQEVLFFDEFRDSIKISDMLLVCDVYPVQLHSRYTNGIGCHKKVYIASNWSLEEQYQDIQAYDPDSWDAFLRRISKVIEFTNFGEYTIYNSVEEYFDAR